MSIAHPTTEDERFMKRALDEARAALESGGAGVVAVLTLRGDILTIARNTSQETGDLTDHAEMVALRQAARQLQAMDDDTRREVTIYVTLEPCLMCATALSFVGIRRVVYAATAEDANEEESIVRGETIMTINERLTRGPFELVCGVRRSEGQALLRQMGKQAGMPADLKT